MTKKIIIAGAGHGGLLCAVKLAQHDFDVLVLERNVPETLGHDWEDRFSFPLLERYLNVSEKDLPVGCFRVRGDCTFISPDKTAHIDIFYGDRPQKIMWRQALIGLLVDRAEKAGVRFLFGETVLSPVVRENTVCGVRTDKGEYLADLVVDACGVFSPLRTRLPSAFGIEAEPKSGDLFYAYRAYFDKTKGEKPTLPFEVYLCHEGEAGLSWLCTNENSVDILIGRIYPLSPEKVQKELDTFRREHDWVGEKILNGGSYAVLPVRKPLPLMVANGYVAVGDSAFMTTPLNGMGIDLSMQAGELLADTLLAAPDFSAASLWQYNRLYHIRFASVLQNLGLKNALLTMPEGYVDFLFKNGIILAADLSGEGKNKTPAILLGKFIRGMRKPKAFFAVLKGIFAGGKVASLYAKPPKTYSLPAIQKWAKKIAAYDVTYGDSLSE